MPFRAIAILSALSLLTSCNSSSSTVALNGAGSTFVYPVMGRWIQDFQQSHTNVRINYQSIGSGGGIQQVKSGTIDFGASDAPLSDSDMAQMAPVIQIPESAGPVCVTYNLDGLQKPLQLSSDALAGIFLGKITSWQDPLVKKDNPGEKLPNAKITVVHRAESSGTTAAFTTYLSAVSPEWAQQVSKGTAVKWPTGLGAKGSEGVTGQVKQSPGAISYVELTYATQNKLPVAAIKNQAGKYVLPSTAGTTAAIDAFKDQLAKDAADSDRQSAGFGARCISYFHSDLPDHPQRRQGRAEADRVEAIYHLCGDGWPAGRERPELRSSSRRSEATGREDVKPTDGQRQPDSVEEKSRDLFRSGRQLRAPS